MAEITLGRVPGWDGGTLLLCLFVILCPLSAEH